VKPLHILCLLAVTSPLLALLPQQDPATDWAVEVERACTAQRYGLRVAAGKKIAAAGAAAVPALRAHERAVGRNQLPATLLEAIAEATPCDPEVVALLRDWATDRDFYWRATALRGLARRAPKLPEQADELRALFAEHVADPAWLCRVHARLGLELLGAPAADQPAETDVRAVVKLAVLLLQAGRVPPLQPLLDALDDERTMLADPFGPRLAREAFDALKVWLGADHPLASGEAFTDRGSGVQAMLEAVRRKSGQTLQRPVPRRDPAVPFAGGFEILSCRNGDQFVCWTEAGELHFGLEGAVRVALDAAVWQRLSAARAALDWSGGLGAIVCDNLRVRWAGGEVHHKVAPGALPAGAAAWFEDLAAAVAAAGRADVAAVLRVGIGQFRRPS
jgi:hypothetical protein